MQRLLAHNGIYIVCYAAMLHTAWGLALLLSPAFPMATPVAPLKAIFGSARGCGAAILFISIIAVVGKIVWRDSWRCLFSITAQQLLLMASALASVAAIASGSYLDGVSRDPYFIFCDQFPNIAGMLAHTAYVVALTSKLLVDALHGYVHGED